MTASLIKPNFTAGEISPNLYGRVDLQKFHSGVGTMRNFFVNYRGGASTRAGTQFIGISPETGDTPPRLIEFVFSTEQSYVLEFGHQYIRVILDGGYVLEDDYSILDISIGTTATITTSTVHDFVVGDHIYLADIADIPRLSNRIVEVSAATATSFTVKDMFGSYISTVGETYTSGGTASKVYTITSPYDIEDLALIKFAQSADVMTLTHKSYPIYELARIGATNWVLSQASFEASISPPSAPTVTRTKAGTTTYSYKITAVDYETGDESQPSPSGSVTDSVTISVEQGAINIAWDAVAGAKYYNIYKGPDGIDGAEIPVGSIYGFAGFTYGTSFVDDNIVEDATKTPPKHSDPFARGRILNINVTNGGSTYTQSGTTATITSTTGSGVLLTPIVVSGAVVAIIVENQGSGYTDADHVSITGGDSTATATFDLGATSGTYPGIVTYFQQRRIFASTLQNPDTYFMSQPGAFSNFDASLPTIATDAIIGTPWSTQVNGIAAMVAMPGGIVILTGGGAWQVSGGQQNATITPGQQVATPQAYNGCSNVVTPVVINYDILYVQQKGSSVYDLSYNFFVNIYTGEDLTILSSHLFRDKIIREWAWAQEPYKIVWIVQDDGTLLSFTFLKEQEIKGWARHDTNGKFVSVCSISEPPIDAVYFIVKRYVSGAYRYFIERMNGRSWKNAEDCWCVDSGLTTSLERPDSLLTASAITGNNVTFTATNAVFSADDVGKVIRYHGGKATITGYTSNKIVTADITQDIKKVVPSRTNDRAFPCESGEWSMAPEVTELNGLHHLEGETVAILADGSVVADQVVSDGKITLETPASCVTAGLPFQAQLQTLYLDIPGQATTTQGARKNIYSVKIRVEASRGIKVSTNQEDASIDPYALFKEWTHLREVRERRNTVSAGTAAPLLTGDVTVTVDGTWNERGTIAIQQDYPLPLSITAIIPDFELGDENG